MRQIFDNDLIIAITAIIGRVMRLDYRARVRRRRVENDDGTRWSSITAIDTKTASVKLGILDDCDESACERYSGGTPPEGDGFKVDLLIRIANTNGASHDGLQYLAESHCIFGMKQTYDIRDNCGGALVQRNASMSVGIRGHVNLDVRKLARLRYSPLQGKDGSIRRDTCSVNDDILHCNEESRGSSRVVSRIVITIHHRTSVEIGSSFENRHVVGIANENGVQSQVQLFGEYISPPRDEHLGRSRGHFVVVTVPAVSVIVDRILQVLRVIGAAISLCVVRLYVPIDGISEVAREERRISSSIPSVVLLIQPISRRVGTNRSAAGCCFSHRSRVQDGLI